MRDRAYFLRQAKELAATYCVLLTDKQHTRFVEALADALYFAYRLGQGDRPQ